MVSPNCCSTILKCLPELRSSNSSPQQKIGVISFNLNLNYKSKKNIVKNLKSDSKKYAQKLFYYFRDFDNKNVDLIIVQGIKEKELGLAVMSRLKKATSKFL